MEPMACTARVDGNRAEVWAGVQDPLNARATAAKALKLRAEQVRFTNLPLGGGFGRRLPFTFDYVDLGVRIARAMSPTPVKLVWSRENDIQHDYYRPAGMARFAGALDKSGTPRAVASHYAGGGDSGPNPYDFLLAALGACTAITLRLYAERKALPLDRVTVKLSHAKIHAADCEACETKEGKIDRIEREIALAGALDAEQRARLLEIADKCPVHRTLTSEVDIRTKELIDPPTG